MSFISYFHYDKKGFGYLDILEDSNTELSVYCRTGRINALGELLDAIPTGIWTGKENPVITDEIGMVVDGFGWKYRLWTPEGEWSHYLIHPDGNKPGTFGCIAPVKYNCRWLFDLLKFIYEKQGEMKVVVDTI